MAIVQTNSGRIFLSNAKRLLVTPYVDEDTVGNTTYDIISIVADTLSITPDDNTINAREWEFGDTPLYETVTLGKVQFAATCIDLQNTILKNIFGWTEDASGNVFMPKTYVDKYASIVVEFADETDPTIILPKVKMNSKVVLASLKTGSAEGQLAGTAYVAKAGSSSSELTESSMGFISNDNSEEIYIDGGDGTTVNVLAE